MRKKEESRNENEVVWREKFSQKERYKGIKVGFLLNLKLKLKEGEGLRRGIEKDGGK